MRASDIRIRNVTTAAESFRYRTPIKFGGVALDRVTILNVTMTVETRGGATATGFGSMPLGNVWAFPSRVLTYEQTLSAMLVAADRVNDLYATATMSGHPIEITHELEPAFRSTAAVVTESMKLAEPMPLLAVFVVASAFDASLHDAFGKVHGLNCYRTYGPPFFDRDLGDFLSPEFRGLTLDRFVSAEPRPSLPLYHLVGALDPLTTSEIDEPVSDWLPETLDEWITRDGLTHLKIKLNGDDLGWDVDRVLRVNRVAEETRPQSDWHYSLDFNERCRSVQDLLDFLSRLREQSPAAFDRVQYIEQPTARDLAAHPDNRMHAAAAVKPIVIDESLLDLETLLMARDLGYTGVAFKACKGQTQSLLLAAAAQHFGMFRCVQDLTCPGASLIHSAGLAAHIPGVAAIEANSRQYCPAANAAWTDRFPGVFEIRNGMMNTGLLTGPGLGAVAEGSRS